jgi:hypothetical protein
MFELDCFKDVFVAEVEAGYYPFLPDKTRLRKRFHKTWLQYLAP